MKTYRIHFICNGLTDGNTERRYIGITDLPLNEEGKEEIAASKGELEFIKPGLVFSSPLTRCTETAGILFPDAVPQIIDEWREYDFGDFEGKSAYELENDPRYTAWTSGKLPSPPNAEDQGDFVKRICLGLNIAVRKMMSEEIFEAAAVIHGGVIMTLFAASALPRKNMLEWTSKAGHGYTALITPSLYGRSGVIEIIDAF